MNYSAVRVAALEETLERPGPAGGVVKIVERRGPARLYGFLAAIALTVSLFLVSANPAWAAEFTVTRSDDPAPNGCGAEDCSLREAVIAANTNGQADTILLPPAANVDPAGASYNLTRGTRGNADANSGDLDITGELTIDGTDPDSPAVNVRSGGIDRAFDVQNGATVTLQELQISGGDSRQVGGGLRNAGTLTIENSFIEDNLTGDGTTSLRRGGGIYNIGSGDLTLNNTVVRNNISRGDGGGIYNSGGDVTLTDSTVDGNTARDDGGGISNDNGGILTLTRSTISNNRAADDGGGLRILDNDPPEQATNTTATNSTISGNEAGSTGGGIASGPNGVLNFVSVTIADNGAPTGGNVFERGRSATFDKTIVANPRNGINCAGGVSSNGDNLEFPGTSCGFEVQADPLLGPLNDNGGFTETQELLDGSPAIDAVGLAPAGGPVTPQSACPGPIEDQRTIDRPQDGDANGSAICDIGAFEVTDDNEPPVAEDDTASTPQDEPITIEAGENDQDPNGDPLTYEITTDPTNGTATINDNGTINYTPNPGFTGDDTLVYQVDDGRGGIDTATVTITVFAVNEFPTARNDTATTAENESVRIRVLQNDSDPDGDSLTVQNFSRPDNGRVSRNPNGTLTYTPNQDFSGRDSFTYTVSDGNGGTDTARVRINVRPAPAPPRADLSVEVNAPNKVRVGNRFSYTVTVSNRGPDTARNVISRSKLPRAVEFVRAPEGCFYNQANRTVTCRLGDIRDGASKQRRIVVEAVKAGKTTLNGCYVKSNTNDPNRSNNTSG